MCLGFPWRNISLNVLSLLHTLVVARTGCGVFLPFFFFFQEWSERFELDFQRLGSSLYSSEYCVILNRWFALLSFSFWIWPGCGGWGEVEGWFRLSSLWDPDPPVEACPPHLNASSSVCTCVCTMQTCVLFLLGSAFTMGWAGTSLLHFKWSVRPAVLFCRWRENVLTLIT